MTSWAPDYTSTLFPLKTGLPILLPLSTTLISLPKSYSRGPYLPQQTPLPLYLPTLGTLAILLLAAASQTLPMFQDPTPEAEPFPNGSSGVDLASSGWETGSAGWPQSTGLRGHCTVLAGMSYPPELGT